MFIVFPCSRQTLAKTQYKPTLTEIIIIINKNRHKHLMSSDTCFSQDMVFPNTMNIEITKHICQ